MKNSVGNPVVGEERFWDRDADIALFTQLLDDGAHIQLIAQRRIGKTSLMKEVARRIDDRYLCLNLDVQSASSPADAVAALAVATRPHASLWEKTKGVFGNAVAAIRESIDSLEVCEMGVHLRAGLAGDDWQQKGEALFAAIASTRRDTVIFIDEVPILISRILKKGDGNLITPEGRAEADRFLSWLRALALRYQGSIRLVLTGSIGLGPILRQAGLSATINHCTPFDLGPWDHPTAITCLNLLAPNYGLTFADGVPERMVALLGCCIPHHVQMYFSYANMRCVRRGDMRFTLADADNVYATEMLGPRGHQELSHYEERLRMVLGNALAALAFELLTEAATPDGLAQSDVEAICDAYEVEDMRPHDVLTEVMGILEHDGYIRRDGARYVFVSSLLRDWWNARFGRREVCRCA